jgi:hypothetical protein
MKRALVRKQLKEEIIHVGKKRLADPGRLANSKKCKGKKLRTTKHHNTGIFWGYYWNRRLLHMDLIIGPGSSNRVKTTTNSPGLGTQIIAFG